MAKNFRFTCRIFLKSLCSLYGTSENLEESLASVQVLLLHCHLMEVFSSHLVKNPKESQRILLIKNWYTKQFNFIG